MLLVFLKFCLADDLALAQMNGQTVI